jgi:hypothetical protein
LMPVARPGSFRTQDKDFISFGSSYPHDRPDSGLHGGRSAN